MSKLGTASKAPFIFVVGGREYQLAPTEIADLGEFEKWLEVRPFEAARKQMKALGDMLTPEATSIILEGAQKAADNSAIDTLSYAQRMASLEGTIYMMWLSLRKNHPDITREEVGAFVTIDNLQEWQDRLDQVTGMVDADENPTDSPAPESAPQPTGEVSTE